MSGQGKEDRGANLGEIKTLHFITTSPRHSRADSDNQGDHRKLDRLSQQKLRVLNSKEKKYI